MEHERRTKMITIVVLVVIAFGLSIGFAVYSKNLNIQNIQATVTGGQSNFNVVFSTSSTSASEGTVAGSKFWDAPAGTGGTATLSGTTISNLTATLPASVGGVEYNFYVYNKGSITAYLTDIDYGKQTCTGAPGTSDELVQAACSDIGIQINGAYKKLDPAKGGSIQIIISGQGRHMVDGDFTATIPSITFTYSSQKPSD